MFEGKGGIEENRLVWLEFIKSYPKDRNQPHYIVIPGASGQWGPSATLPNFATKTLSGACLYAH